MNEQISRFQSIHFASVNKFVRFRFDSIGFLVTFVDRLNLVAIVYEFAGSVRSDNLYVRRLVLVFFELQTIYKAIARNFLQVVETSQRSN